MKTNPINWFNKPTKTQFLIILLIWIVSISMLIIGVTDLFKKPLPLNILLLSVIPSSLIVLTVMINFIKNKKDLKETK
ncbi:hypothetical protein [uncultured Flavobacterium sp.]|uniref:hypothetical protein n=1 Tax=uncultured Flavobacterium sp. TaxID=165435 RepID=UPI0030C7E6DC